MNTKRCFYLCVLLLLGAATVGWTQLFTTTFEAYTSVGIMEADNVTPLRGNSEGGDLVQLLWVGPDGQIAEPDSFGNPTADDSLLGVTYIGHGYPFNPDEGLFAAVFRHELLKTGSRVYVRAWNDSVAEKAAYGNSLTYVINSDFDSHDFGLDFLEDNAWRMHGGSFEPVELALFTATDEAGLVLLRWSTYSETDNLGFHLYRATARDSGRVRITEQLIDGAVNSQTVHTYYFRDRQVEEQQKYFYWLADVSASGVEMLHGPISLTTQTQPEAFTLQQNFPNPFNPTTSIVYTVKEAGPVRVQIFNIMGQLVRTLVNASQSAGRYDVLWDGRDMNNQPVPSGTYLCMMEAGSYRTFIKMTMAK